MTLFRLVALISIIAFTSNATIECQNVSFSASDLQGTNLTDPTSIQFGPDSRLYVAQQNGSINIYTISKIGPNNYQVIAEENIDLIKNMPNHNDDGTVKTGLNKRQITGILVTGTASNPCIYVGSSDPRIGGGGTGGDVGLDTNSGIISKLTWNGTSWDKVDIIIGLPRSEENHANNGMQLDEVNNILYVASGGFTNAGAPSNNFAFITEYALSAAILEIDLNIIDSQFGGTYEIPTLDDPTRPNVNDIVDPLVAGYDGIDVGDPYGGNDGLNQGKIVIGGPVQIHSAGYRNSYDLVLTKTSGIEGRLYTIDNGANGGWGGHPVLEGAFGNPLTTNVTNDYDSNEPGSNGPGPNDAKVNNLDNLHLVSSPSLNPIYGGHPTPIRANPSGAGLYTKGSHTFDPNDGGDDLWRTTILSPVDTSFSTQSLPVDWPPVPISMANPVEGDFQNPGVDDGALYTWLTSTNGLTEYISNAFEGTMQGDLLTASFDNNIYRIELNTQGTAVTTVTSIASGFGDTPLDITANGPLDPFDGTIWVANYGSNTITILEPDSWQILGPSDGNDPEKRHENGFVELNGKFYLIGGRGSKPLDIYDPVTNTWSTGASPPLEFHHFQAVSTNGLIYIMGAFVGGFPSETPVPNVYIYDPNLDQWTMGPAIPSGRERGSAGVVTYNGKIYLVCGIINGHQSGWVPWLDEFDPITNMWTQLPDAPRARDHANAAVVDGKIVLAGGRRSGEITTFTPTIPEVDVYNIGTQTWSTLPANANIPTERAGAASAVLNGLLMIVGGESGSQQLAHNETEMLNLTTNEWSSVAFLNVGRHGTQAISYDSKVYIAAGSGEKGSNPELTSMEVFTGVTCTGEISTAIDDDGDGYSNSDEIDNGTDPCSSASRPPDNDGDLLSDLNDSDDDNDGILDANDPFALDIDNGSSTDLPVNYPLLNADPGIGLFGLGFTGLMINGTDIYDQLYDANTVVMGGAVGLATFEAEAGDALFGNQRSAFQWGVNVNSSNESFTVHSQLEGTPFFDNETLVDQSQGIYIGNGDQDNYLKIVLVANNGNPGFRVLYEDGGVVTLDYLQPVTDILLEPQIDLYFEINPGTGEVIVKYSTDSSPSPATVTNVSLTGNLLSTLQGPDALAIGMIASSGSADTFSATYDFFIINAETPAVLNPVEDATLIVNSGNLVIDLNEVFTDDDGAENLILTVEDTSNPALVSGTDITSGILTVTFAPDELGSSDITVRATDGNLLYTEDVFNIAISAPEIILEAECAVVGSDWSILSDLEASGGSYVVSTTAESTFAPPVGPDGLISFDFNVIEANDFEIHARIKAPTSADNSLWVRVNGSSWIKWSSGISTGNQYNWNVVPGSPFSLGAGSNQIEIGYRENGTQLDKIELIPVGGVAPTGEGGIGGNCGNQAPLVTNPGTTSYFEGEAVNLQIEATDPNIGDVLTYTESGLPASLVLDPNTGLIGGTLEASANTYPVTVTVTDQEGLFNSVAFDIVISDGTPVVSNPIEDATLVVNSGDHIVDLTTVFDDNDGVGGLTYTIEGISNSTLVTGTDITSGILTVTFASDELGSSDITVRATDGNLLFAEDVFTITVIDVPLQIVLEAECGVVGSDWSVINDAEASGGNYVVSTTAESTFAAPAGPDGWVSFDFTVAEANDYQIYARIKAPSSADNSFWVRVNGGSWTRWSSGISTGSQFNWSEVPGGPFNFGVGNNLIEFGYRENGAQLDKLEVIPVGGATPTGVGGLGINCGNQAPLVTNPGTTSYFAGDVVNLQIEATDPNMGDVLTYSESGLPASLMIDPVTGLITGTLTVPSNTYPVTVTVTDQEGLFNSVAFDIVISDGTPIVSNPVEDATLVVNSGDHIVDLTTVFDDNDGVGGLTYTIEGISNSTLVTGTDITSGILTVTFASDELGSSDITVRATDGNLLFAEDVFTITVIDVPLQIVLEAECGVVGSDWSVINDAEASGGSYVVSTTAQSASSAPAGPDGWVSFDFTVAEANDYQIYARIKAPSSADNSFWVRVNGGSWIKWSGGISTGSQFNWSEVPGGPFNFGVGNNLIEFGYRENGAQLDKLEVIPVGGATPTGVGGLGINCGNQAPLVTNPGTTSYFAGDVVNLQIEATDPNMGDVLTYSESGLPASLMIDPVTGLITGTLTVPPNTYPVTVTVTDQEGLFNSVAFDIVISDGTPIVSNPIEDATLVVNSGDHIVDLTTVFDDNDGVGGLTYTIEGISNSTLVTGTDITSGILTVTFASDELGSSDITVRATDGNLLFAEDVFTITVIDVPLQIVLEAECGVVGSDWSVINDAEASGGSYVVSTTAQSASSAPAGPDGWVSFDFTVAEANDYQIYARIKAPSTADNSFWVRVNGGSWIKWSKGISTGSQFNWSEVPGGPFNFGAGNNLIEIGYRENGAQLDKLEVIPVGGTPPTGMGGVGINCGSPPPAVLNNEASYEMGQSVLIQDSLDVFMRQPFKIYPNPAEKNFSIELNSHTGDLINIYLINNVGQTYSLGAYQVNKGYNILEFDIATESIADGVYLLKVQSRSQSYDPKKLIIHR